MSDALRLFSGIDFLHLAPAQSLLCRALPALEWPKRFNVRAARSIVMRIDPPRRRTLAARKLEALLAPQATWRDRRSR
jgi:hypothetical protein